MTFFASAIFDDTDLNLSIYLSLVKRSWKEIWRDKSFRWLMLLCVLYIAALPFFFPRFFDFIEKRDGKTLHDIVLEHLPAMELCWLIFLCLYTGMFLGLIYLIAHPYRFLLVLLTYCMATTLRVVSIYIFPLDPPIGYIPLHEPVAQFFTNGGRIISKDLFFSGHVTTIMSLFYPIRNKILRPIVLFLSAMVGVLVLVQHVHYTIDVLMAVVATYFCFLLSKRITAGIKVNEL